MFMAICSSQEEGQHRVAHRVLRFCRSVNEKWYKKIPHSRQAEEVHSTGVFCMISVRLPLDLPDFHTREHEQSSHERVPEAAHRDGEGTTTFEPTARGASPDSGNRSCNWFMRCGSSSRAQGKSSGFRSGRLRSGPLPPHDPHIGGARACEAQWQLTRQRGSSSLPRR